MYCPGVSRILDMRTNINITHRFVTVSAWRFGAVGGIAPEMLRYVMLAGNWYIFKASPSCGLHTNPRPGPQF
jgi:hypothetical protein